MRTIKFRAWDKNANKMSDVVELSWGNHGDFDVFTSHGINASALGGDCLMQFTGLKDRNGKEIYEGDIVKLGGKGGSITEVKWMDGGFRVEQIEFRDVMEPLLKHKAWVELHIENRGLEVIGNHFEHPELLK